MRYIGFPFGMKKLRLLLLEQKPSSLDHPWKTLSPTILKFLVDRHELVFPPVISTAEMAGFSLYLMKAVLNSRTNEIIELARSNVLNK